MTFDSRNPPIGGENVRIVMYVCIILAVIVGLYLLHRLAVQVETRKLRAEIAALRANESAEMQLLRNELVAYASLVDGILDAVNASESAALPYGGVRQCIRTIIAIDRPKRTF